VRSRRARGFRETYARLPQAVRAHAIDAYALFSNDPFHPGLQFKQVDSRDGVWSVRIGNHHRALAWRRGDELVWFWIGTHAEYDQLLRRR
jgi:hypothetical protein